uniref:Invertebrate defensins family profile domain-containing protein n=1 Tax=Phlebotomus papatasi TaxID=29031 RepID=A0A1B0D9E4_PHLPP
MSIFKVSFFFVLLLGVVLAGPVKDDVKDPVEENPELVFQPRVTCDILGPTGWGDAFCAGHCIYLGYAGGWCDDRKVCNCRN